MKKATLMKIGLNVLAFAGLFITGFLGGIGIGWLEDQIDENF